MTLPANDQLIRVHNPLYTTSDSWAAAPLVSAYIASKNFPCYPSVTPRLSPALSSTPFPSLKILLELFLYIFHFGSQFPFVVCLVVWLDGKLLKYLELSELCFKTTKLVYIYYYSTTVKALVLSISKKYYLKVVVFIACVTKCFFNPFTGAEK